MKTAVKKQPEKKKISKLMKFALKYKGSIEILDVDLIMNPYKYDIAE